MTAAAAVNQLASGEPPINFAAHQFRAGNIAGAREDFEQMLALLVGAVHPAARLIAANPGDWGIDVLVGELSGCVVIWQAKYFWPAVTRAKQAAIRESFNSAYTNAGRNGYTLRRWVLCVPSSMDAPTAKWWDNWRTRKQRETGVEIDVWHETTLRRLLITPDAADVRRHYYDPYQPGAPLPEPHRLPVRPLDVEAAAGYEHALFVRQLRAAGHAEVEAAKREFFNADLMAREVTDKGVPVELDALAEADAVVHGIWEARFNAACVSAAGSNAAGSNAAGHAQPADPRLPGLHIRVMHEVRETASFPPALRAGPVHRCGMLHRVVEDRRAGWVVGWREIAAGSEARGAGAAGDDSDGVTVVAPRLPGARSGEEGST